MLCYEKHPDVYIFQQPPLNVYFYLTSLLNFILPRNNPCDVLSIFLRFCPRGEEYWQEDGRGIFCVLTNNFLRRYREIRQLPGPGDIRHSQSLQPDAKMVHGSQQNIGRVRVRLHN